MEAVFSGILYDKYNRTSQPVTLVGEFFRTDVGIGGGPIIPPGQPPHIWGGGNVPMPSPPIANVPGAPGYNPPVHIWGGGNEPFPTPPIVIPGPPVDPPPNGGGGEDGVVKPPPPDGGWGYVEPYGWAFFPMGGRGPKK